MSCLKVQDICHLLLLFPGDHLLIQFNPIPKLPGVIAAQPTPEHPHWKYWD